MLRPLFLAAAALPGALTLGVLHPGAEVEAQTQEGPRRECTLRGRPLPECTSFLIFEMQGVEPLAQTRGRVFVTPSGPSYPYPEIPGRLEWNLGAMANATPSWAVGGVFTLGWGAPRGLRLRARRWLNREASVELEGGLLRETSEWSSTTGLTAGARLNFRDQLSLFARWDRLEVPSTSPAYPEPGVFQQALSVGGGLGGGPALIGTATVGVGVLILMLIVFSDPNYT